MNFFLFLLTLSFHIHLSLASLDSNNAPEKDYESKRSEYNVKNAWDPDLNLYNPEDIPISRVGEVDVGIILSNIASANTKMAEKMIAKFTVMLDSMLTFSTGTPIRFLILTESASIPTISKLFSDRIGRYISTTIINQGPLNAGELLVRVPRIETCYVNISAIIHRHKKKIDFMKIYYGKISDDGKTVKETKNKIYDGKLIEHIDINTKYRQDLFYILPFYHLEFPAELKKLIVLDIDLEFFTDISVLYAEFKKFASHEVMGVGVTKTPFYMDFLKRLKKSYPDTDLGKPGRFQGLNTGVVLLDLARMRDNQMYFNATQQETMYNLNNKYNFIGSVGDQDWLTLVSLEMPELIYLLPCQMNMDEHRPGECHNDNVYEWEVVNKAYHQCDQPTLIKHRAGSM